MSKSEGRWNFNREEEELLREVEMSPEGMQAKYQGCPRPEMILAAQSGVLPEELNKKITEHLASCRSCAALGHDMTNQQIADPTAAEQGRIKERIEQGSKKGRAVFGRGRLWTRLLAASAVIIVFVSALLWYRGRSISPPPNTTVTTQQPAPHATESVFKLEKAPLKLSAASVLVWRGGSKQAYARELANALEPYRRDNFAEAAARLQQVVRQYPNSVVAYFYLAVSQMFLNRNNDAIENLRKAQGLQEESLQREIRWYLALAYQRTGEKENALAELDKLCNEAGAYSAQACGGLQELRAGTH